MNKGIATFLKVTRGGKERGFTLLEYCAGAAVVLAVLYVALNAMGGNMSNLMSRVGEWADARTADIQVTPPPK